MKDNELYRQTFLKLKASENTVDVLEEKYMKQRKTIRMRKLMIAVICLALIIAVPMAANAATGGALLKKVLVFFNGKESIDVEVYVSEDGVVTIPGAESLEPGAVIYYMDNDPNSPNYKKGANIVIGDMQNQKDKGFYTVTSTISPKNVRYTVTKTTESKGNADIDFNQQQTEKTEEFAGTNKFLTCCYSVENGHLVLKP